MMSKLLLGAAMAALAATAAVAQAAPVPGHPHASGRIAQTEARADVQGMSRRCSAGSTPTTTGS